MDRTGADGGELRAVLFTLIGEELAGRIEFVCSDMWQPYLTVIRERCGQAIHILDRFPHCGQDERRAGPGKCRRSAPAGA